MALQIALLKPKLYSFTHQPEMVIDSLFSLYYCYDYYYGFKLGNLPNWVMPKSLFAKTAKLVTCLTYNQVVYCDYVVAKQTPLTSSLNC